MYIRKKINKNIILEIVKWVGSLFLLIVAGVLNYMYCNYDLFIRGIIIFVAVTSVVCILLTTTLGRFIMNFSKEAYIELQKVVWPSYQDTFHTTLVVIVLSIVISVILWGLDTILVHVISFGLRL